MRSRRHPPRPPQIIFPNVSPDDERKLLDEEWAAAFHHGVAQLLLELPWASKDIQTLVVLLTTRVQAPDE